MGKLNVRVLVLGDARQPHTARWTAALAAAGAEVQACSMQAPLGEFPAPLEIVPASGPRFLRHRAALPRLLERCADFTPHLISALFVPDYGFLGAHLKARLGGARLGGAGPRLWVAALGSDLLRNARRSPFHLLRARWTLGRADQVIVDAALLGHAAESLGAPPEKVRLVRWLPDLERFAFRPDFTPAAPARVVSTRQLAPVYDVGTAIRAMRLVGARRSGVELVVAGDGPQRETLERAAAPLARSVRFAGRLDATGIAGLLQGGPIYVSTARSDSTSVSLLEAMACGAFPVVSAIPGNREWITEGSSGLLFPPGDAGTLAEKISRALDDNILRERVQLFNRRRLESLPGFEKAVRELLGEVGALPIGR